MQKLRLVLSFDHELSLGGTDSYRYNLFDPTDQLLRLAGDLGVPIVLFTDVLCAMRFVDWDHDGFFVPYRRQLESALRSGHDVQLHVHPHWVDSTWAGGVYQPSTSFALDAFATAEPPNDIRSIVRRSYDFLSELCLAADPRYSCIAYRAGGFNLSPHEKLLPALRECGIRIDSSIIKGYRFSSGISQVDYSEIPARANWTLFPWGIFEVPIAAKPRTPLNNVPFLVNRVLHRRRAHDPKGRTIHAAHTGMLARLGKLFPRSAWTLGFDDAAQSLGDVMGILYAHLEAHRRDDQVICAAIAHPKNMGPYEFGLMRGFVERARSELGSALTFTTFQELHREMRSPQVQTREAGPFASSGLGIRKP